MQNATGNVPLFTNALALWPVPNEENYPTASLILRVHHQQQQRTLCSESSVWLVRVLSRRRRRYDGITKSDGFANSEDTALHKQEYLPHSHRSCGTEMRLLTWSCEPTHNYPGSKHLLLLLCLQCPWSGFIIICRGQPASSCCGRRINKVALSLYYCNCGSSTLMGLFVACDRYFANRINKYYYMVPID